MKKRNILTCHKANKRQARKFWKDSFCTKSLSFACLYGDSCELEYFTDFYGKVFILPDEF